FQHESLIFFACARKRKRPPKLVRQPLESKRPEFVSILREEPRINYPWEAIRELAMNAVMHRAYNGNNSPIKFYEYSDRIEIDNPGNLYGKVNLENFPNETDYRNPNIAEIMLNLGYVNRFGSGVNTVSALLEENRNYPAEFLLGDYTTFKVLVQNADVIGKTQNVIGNDTDKVSNVTTNVTDKTDHIIDGHTEVTDKTRGEKIVDIMRHDKRVSVRQLSKMLGVTTRTIFREIDELKANGKIARVGNVKSGTWEVLEYS
ncbi:MAG: HTH domain-containing protein, partial [Muribaculaceae bacterium]|nr:HTH domain-containing protein [Muribaculaceae bacterium]